LKKRTIVATLALAFLAGLLPATPGMATGRDTRTVSVPGTMARTKLLPARRGDVKFAVSATHFAFSWTGDEGTGVAYRIIGSNGPARWQRAPESGDMESEDTHYSAMIPVKRVSRIQYRPIEPRRKKIGRIRLDYLNTLDGPRIERTIPVSARATTGADTPEIITRAEWGADESVKRTSGGCKRKFFPVQQLFVHHTAGKNRDRNPKATMRAIYWFHTVRRGWCDLGYNFVISWDGRIFEGRWARRYQPWETHNSEDAQGRAAGGAHVAGFNSGSIGISLMGNFQTAKLPRAMRRGLVDLLAYEADRHDLPPRGRHVYRNPETGKSKRLPYIAGHRDAGSTSCPGGDIYRRLPGIRRSVANRVGNGKPSSELTLEAERSSVFYGEQMTATGVLTRENGTPLAGRRVTIYKRAGRSRWKDAGRLQTDVDGSFDYSSSPKRITRLVGVFPDASDVWGSRSSIVRVNVRHAVALEATGGVPDTSGAVIYPPGTQQVSFQGTGAPPHGGSRIVKIWIGRVEDDGTSVKLVDTETPLSSTGTFTYDFKVPPQSGATTYRAIARYPGDAAHVWGKSDPVDFIVGS
jgi:hypothetical protein